MKLKGRPPLHEKDRKVHITARLSPVAVEFLRKLGGNSISAGIERLIALFKDRR